MTELLNKPKGLPLAERFWRHVDKSGDCWIWTGVQTGTGYGVFIRDARRGYQSESRVPAHRMAYELTYGRPIPDDLFACHSCDNPPCVRPDHIFIGTQTDNMQDAARKGRTWSPAAHIPEVMPRGEQHKSSKLTTDQVLAIRSRHISGERVRALSREFAVSSSAISLIIARKNWRHV